MPAPGGQASELWRPPRRHQDSASNMLRGLSARAVLYDKCRHELRLVITGESGGKVEGRAGARVGARVGAKVRARARVGASAVVKMRG